MGLDLYAVRASKDRKSHKASNVLNGMGRLTGHAQFIEILTDRPHETLTISEYDGEYAWRPLDLEDMKEAMLESMENSKVGKPSIQTGHIHILYLMAQDPDLFVGMSN